MHHFTDAKGNKWTLEILIGEIPRIEQETGVHLLLLDRPIEEDQDKWKDGEGRAMAGLQRLMFDLPLLYRVIYSLCAQQVQELKLTPTDFGRCIGEVHEQAYDTFFLELRDFFQKIRQTAAATFVDKQQQLMTQLQQVMVGMYEKINSDEIVADLNRRLESILGQKSGASQESLELTPGR